MLTEKHRQQTTKLGGGVVKGDAEWGRGLVPIFDYTAQADDELSEHTLKPSRPRIQEHLFAQIVTTWITRQSTLDSALPRASCGHLQIICTCKALSPMQWWMTKLTSVQLMSLNQHTKVKLLEVYFMCILSIFLYLNHFILSLLSPSDTWLLNF